MPCSYTHYREIIFLQVPDYHPFILTFTIDWKLDSQTG